MLLYSISLFFGIFGTAAIYWAFSRSIERNGNWRNRKPIGFLAPVFLSVLLVAFAVGFTAPRLQDLVALASGNMVVQEIELEPNQIHLLVFEVDDKSYYYNRLETRPLPTTAYRMTALPYSRHVLWLEPIAEDTDAGGPK